MLSLIRSQLFGSLAIRENQAMLGALVLLPPLFAIGSFALGATSTPPSQVRTLSELTLFAGPSFVLQAIYGLFAARSEAASGFSSDYLREPRRGVAWSAKLIAVMFTGGAAALIGQLLVWLVLPIWVSSTHLDNAELAEVSLAMVGQQISGVLIGIAVARFVRDSLWAPVSLIALLWFAPRLVGVAAILFSGLAISLSDFSPVQIAQRLVWRAPMQPVSFAGIEMSGLSLEAAIAVLVTWSLTAVATILFGHNVQYIFSGARFRSRRHGRYRPGKVTNSARVGRLTKIAAMRPFLREIYVAATSRGDRVLYVATGMLVALTMLAAVTRAREFAASSEMVNTPSRLIEMSTSQIIAFGYAPLPALLGVVATALILARDSNQGENVVAVLAIPNRATIWFNKITARVFWFAAAGILGFVTGAGLTQISSDIAIFDSPESRAILGEAFAKLLLSTAIAVLLGAGIGFVAKTPSSTLLTVLSVLLIYPGVVAIWWASGVLRDAATWAMTLAAPTGFAVQHWDWSSPQPVGGAGDLALNPDQHLMITAAWATIFGIAGVLRLAKEPVR